MVNLMYYAVTLEFDKESEARMQEMIDEVGNKGNYLPNHWVPHAAIAVKLTPEALKEAFAVVQEKFTPFEAIAERIVLARAEPYEELKAWELKTV